MSTPFEDEVKKEVSKIEQLVKTGAVITWDHIEALVNLVKDPVQVNQAGVIHEEHRPTTDVDAIQADADSYGETSEDDAQPVQPVVENAPGVLADPSSPPEPDVADTGSDDPDAGTADRHTENQ